MFRLLEKTLEKWMGALLKTKQTFQNEKGNASLVEGAIYILIAGIIDSIPFYSSMVSVWPYVNTEFITLFQELGISIEFNKALLLKLTLFYPIGLIIVWLTISVFLILSAKLVKGRGNFTVQSYLLALVIAPLTILSGVIYLVPIEHETINSLILLLFFLFIFYLITMALKEAHEYSTIRAVSTLLIAIVLSEIVHGVLIAILVTTHVF